MIMRGKRTNFLLLYALVCVIRSILYNPKIGLDQVWISFFRQNIQYAQAYVYTHYMYMHMVYVRYAYIAVI